MKLRKVLIYIYISILILSFISLIVLNVLGSKERIGYLGNLNFISSESYSNNYVYSFRINYYNKVFRNSDIYGVYLNTNSFPKYIKEIKMKDEFGTPFGSLVSINKLEGEKIDNIKYILKIKKYIYLLFILILFLFIILMYILYDFIILINTLFDKFNFSFLSKKYIIPIILFLFVFFILFNIAVEYVFVIFILLLLLYGIKFVSIFNVKRYCIIFLFLSFLMLPIIVYSIFYRYFDHNNYENRVLSKKVNIFDIKIDEYNVKYEMYFNDHIPFRNELIYLKNIIDIILFKSIISDKILLGKDHWLFLRSDDVLKKYIGLESAYFTNEELEKAKENLLHFRDELKKRNIDFVLMICPDKDIIYHEYIPDYIRRKKIITSTDEFVNYMKKNTDIKIVYPKNELLKYKKDYQLYYKFSDYTHWNYIGGYIAYIELMNTLNINVSNLENIRFNILTNNLKHYLLNKYEHDFYTDFKLDYGIVEYNIDKYILYNHNIYQLDNYNISYYLYKIDPNFYHTYVKTVSYYEKTTNNLLMLRDSYAVSMFDYIASSFNEVYFSHLDNFNNIKNFATNINIVLFESVERSLKTRLLERIPEYKMNDIFTN